MRNKEVFFVSACFCFATSRIYFVNQFSEQLPSFFNLLRCQTVSVNQENDTYLKIQP